MSMSNDTVRQNIYDYLLMLSNFVLETRTITYEQYTAEA